MLGQIPFPPVPPQWYSEFWSSFYEALIAVNIL
jgi:hypothetical protein